MSTPITFTTRRRPARLRHILATAVLTAAALSCLAGTASAQPTRGTVAEPSPIFLKPDDRLVPLRTAATGTSLLVLQTTEEWLQVEFQDPQFGRRIGWIRSERVRVQQPNAEPLDLSVPADEPPASRSPANTPVAAEENDDQERDRDDRPARRMRPRAADSPNAVTERGWIDVNLGAAWSGADDQAFVYTTTLFREPAAFAAAYPEPSTGASFDVGGGVMFSPWLGAGVSLVGTAHEDIVGLGATVPHPYFFNAEETAGGATDEKLLRTEGSVNIQAMFVAHQSRRLRARVFGGPSYFRYEADMVGAIEYDQFAVSFLTTQVVEITGHESLKTEGTGWGWHVGGDVSVFFTRVFGLGGFARYSRGAVEIDEPLSGSTEDVTVGGFQAGGGIRLRF